jgi:pimeloyl-ACP methyl ester carboxylesterase
MAVLALLLPTACSLTPAPIRQHRWLTFTPACQQRVAKDLSAAAAAWDTLKSSTPGSSEYRAADDVYNRAVAGVVRSWGSRELPCKWKNGRVFEMKVKGASRVKGETPRTRNPQGTEKYVMEFLPAEASRSSEISPLSLDRVLVAERIRIQRGSKAAVAEGLGVPVVGQIMRSETLAKKQPLLPLNGANLTLTAVIEFDTLPASSRSGEPRRARLRLLNPLVSTQTMVGTRKAPLAANYTAAKERALNDGFLQRFSFLGLFFPDKTLDKSGLFLLDPYDPKRIPVVFVHGLVSDPHIWYNAINAISSDPELRARYQPWYFLYPTGISVPSSAKRLRDSLITAREVLDPEHDDPGMNRMVLVGHSMGGLLSRMQTIDSKDAFWRAYFTARPEALQLSAAARERLVAPLQFERQSYVRRLIFVAVPHRGSSAADVSFIYHLSSLIRLPLDSVRLTKEVLTGNSKFLEPQIRKWGLYSFLSVGTLSPRHPFLQALNAQPIPVPHHSIVGRIGFKPLEDSSDGAVPYKSSHLATGSERVVRHWHSCAQKPDVVAEVVLRLKQHLRENGVR